MRSATSFATLAAPLLLYSAASLAQATDCTRTSTGLTPINDLGTSLYLGQFQGGLYPGGRNDMPDGHEISGIIRGNSVRARTPAGAPSQAGRYILLSIGMSNTSQEFCSGAGASCSPVSFVGQALASPLVNTEHLVMINGAAGGQSAELWDSPAEPNYNRIRDMILTPRGHSELQVQAVWLKVANRIPTQTLPSTDADAYVLLRQLGDTVRALKVRYPNLQQVLVSSRIYGGYHTGGVNPEPYAYENGFSVKWLVQAQITQNNGGAPHPIAGDLSPAVAPWIAWGPHIWADGEAQRSDGLVWRCSDFEADGLHPGPTGRQKVGEMLLNYFLREPTVRTWFRADQGAACVGDFNNDGGTDGEDVDAFFRAWERGTLRADVNRDGGIDGTDIQTFFESWEAGGC
jgi:hypothetical protein